ncbi:hypothetical protein [Borreliella bavariensis]|uniref:hypothetical protein n=1 Tax=Borreliella bavariensis TaxID=664662 RepID=UPI001C00F081|nr:hypothetical protein [Borreliella bavariensis]
MNKKMRMLIICAVFALISSCKNYVSTEDLKQNVEGKVRGFLETKKGIVSDDPTVYEIAEKLKEEELKGKQEKEDKEELMQGDDPANIDQPSILQTNNQDSTPALEAAQQITSGGQQKEEEKGKEEKEQAKAEEVKVKEEQKVVEQKEEQAKAKAEQEKKEKEERERKDKEKQQQEQQKKRQEEEKKKQEEQEKAKAEKERREKEERQIKSKIETLTKKIDEINRDIDSIKYKSWFVENEKRLEVKATEVRDKVTGPIYDHFTDDNKAIYYTWGLDEEESSELTKLLEKLRDTRDKLRTKLNEGNQEATWKNTPSLKENVKVVEIESDLDSLKSELERVKEYLKNESNFEEIKEYISSSDD